MARLEAFGAIFRNPLASIQIALLTQGGHEKCWENNVAMTDSQPADENLEMLLDQKKFRPSHLDRIGCQKRPCALPVDKSAHTEVKSEVKGCPSRGVEMMMARR